MIACICLHPAIDRTLQLEVPLEPGRLHRTSGVLERAGGKGVNVAAVLQQLGVEAVAVLPVGGRNGERLRGMLEDSGIPHRLLEVGGETRETQTIINGDGHPTEIYESGPSLNPRNLSALEALIPDGASWVVLSGSLAPGLELRAFRAWLEHLKTRFRVAVDTSGAALRAALEAGVQLVKPNSAELGQIGMGALEVFELYGVSVLHSRGADGLEYLGPQGYFVQAAYQIAPINPVGAGDATLAGFVAALERDEPIAWAMREAAACGASACLEPVAGAVSAARVGAFLKRSGVGRA